MIPPLVFSQTIHNELAKEVARNLGTTAITSEQLVGLPQPHLKLSEDGLSFFIQRQDQRINFGLILIQVQQDGVLKEQTMKSLSRKL